MSPISIRIEKPCHEDWEKMTPTDTGKFCAACERNVTDFSSMTDNEVLAFLEKNPGKMCGQFRSSQLNRVIVLTKLKAKNYKLNTFFATLMVAGAAGSLSAQSTPAPVYQPNVVIENHKTGQVCIKTPEAPEKYVLHATLVDTLQNMKVANAVVSIKGTNISATTDDNGKFTLHIPDSLAGEAVTLSIYSPGFYWEWVTIRASEINKTNIIEVAFEERMLKGDVMIEETPKKCGNK